MQLRCKEAGLAKEHFVFALALLYVNMRENYPDGAEAFDTIAKSAGEYYREN
jgi:hypothetical protein